MEIGKGTNETGPRACRDDCVRCHAFTLIEMLVVVTVMVMIIALGLAALSQSRSAATSVVCLSQLQKIGQGLHAFANSSGGSMPDPYVLEKSWEESLIPYGFSPASFVCPADQEVAPALGSSYDWRDTGDPDTTMAGKKMILNTRADLVLAFEALPDWHEAGKINVVTLSGQATMMDASACFKDLVTPVR